MTNIETILEFAEALVHADTGGYLSDLQKIILLTTLQGGRKTYEQIADECGYSAKYVQRCVAPKLWQSFSQALGEKVTKKNVRAVLEREMREQKQASKTELFSESPSPIASPSLGVEPIVSTESAVPFRQSESRFSRANILLVDDQPSNLDLLSHLLEEHGYEVRQAINGTVALQAVEVAHPDLILLDINMPELDGYMVCQQLKANPQTEHIPVVFVSALDEAWDKVKAFSVGGADYITKPFKSIEVLARVQQQLKLGELRQSLKRHMVELQTERGKRLDVAAQLRQANRELRRLGALDKITQLANRSRFDRYLEAQWHRIAQKQQFLTLIFCHIDHLSTYKNTYGESAEHKCLARVAQAIKRVAQRSQDLVCHHGDGEYGIVLPNMNSNDSQHLAQLILQQVQILQIPHSQAPIHPYISVSIGIASVIPTLEIKPDDLVKLGYRALRQAQDEGGNCIVALSSL
jgi:diguanylate cyclase (GGDEF)-like protein